MKNLIFILVMCSSYYNSLAQSKDLPLNGVYLIKDSIPVALEKVYLTHSVLYIIDDTLRLSPDEINESGKVKRKSLEQGKLIEINTIPGEKSPIRVSQSSGLSILIKGHKVDASKVNVFKLNKDQYSKDRYIKVKVSTSYEGVSNFDIQYLPFIVNKLHKNSMLIELQFQLEKGEYAITIPGHRNVFYTFGVD